MKKVIASFIAIAFLLLPMSSAFAETTPLNASPKGTCAVIIGDADIKTPDFLKCVDETFNTEKESKKVITGTEIQSLYQKYWLDKGYLEEQKPTKQDLNDFVKYSGYKQVLFLIVNTPVIEKTKSRIGLIQKEQIRASISVKAILENQSPTEKMVEVTKEDDSKASELRAKIGAFQKCLEEIKNVIAL